VTDQVVRGRIQLALIALTFFLPLAFAAWLYIDGRDLQPEGRTNAGRLLDPVVNVEEAGESIDLAELTDGMSDGRWLLVYRNAGACGDDCEQALVRLRQSRLMLGRDMTRLVRVFLHGETAPDKVLLETEHTGLVVTNNGGLGEVLDRRRPDDLAPGGLFLIDPLGNLVMYFAADLAPDAMVDDIEHLLELSRIG